MQGKILKTEVVDGDMASDRKASAEETVDAIEAETVSANALAS